MEAVADFTRHLWFAVGGRRGAVFGATWVHLIPHVPNSNRTLCLLVELHNLHDSFGVALLLETRDAAVREKLLPFLWQTSELASGRVETDVGEVNRIVRGRNLRFFLRIKETLGQSERPDARRRGDATHHP